MPGLQAFDAVQAGTVEACQTSLDYEYGKDPAFAIPTAFPFGMNARQQTAFALDGGGNDLTNAFLADYGVLAFPAGNTGAQMGGFFRHEIKSAADLTGLKIRSGGLAGRILQKLGAVPQQTARSEVVAALVGRYARCRDLGQPLRRPEHRRRGKLQKVAPFYYYPGWWRGGSMVHLVFNKAKYDALPDAFKVALRTAAMATHTAVLASYDAANPSALKKLVIARRRIAGLSAGPARSRLQGHERDVQGDLGRQPAFQNPARRRDHVPCRPVSLVAGQRVYVRQLHDPPARARLSAVHDMGPPRGGPVDDIATYFGINTLSITWTTPFD